MLKKHRSIWTIEPKNLANASSLEVLSKRKLSIGSRTDQTLAKRTRDSQKGTGALSLALRLAWRNQEDGANAA
jgi:hypothetical protein